MGGNRSGSFERSLLKLAHGSRGHAESGQGEVGWFAAAFFLFVLRRIRSVGGASAADIPGLKAAFSESLKVLGATFKLDCRILAFEYRDAVPTALLLYEKELRAQKHAAPASGGDPTWFDNRLVWAKFLDKSFVEKAFPGRVAPFIVLPTLLRVWLSILDGESQVERDLGFLRGFQKAAKGRGQEDLLEDLLLLKLSGPQTGEEAGGAFSVQCVELWRKHIVSSAVRRARRTPRQPAALGRKSGRPSFAEAKRAVLRASVRAQIPSRFFQATSWRGAQQSRSMERRLAEV